MNRINDDIYKRWADFGFFVGVLVALALDGVIVVAIVSYFYFATP